MKLSSARSRIGIGAAALWTCGLLGHADVIVVEGPGFGFELQNAIDAAAEGDTILVKDGIYYAIQIVGKSLTVIADGSSVRIHVSSSSGIPTIEVHDLSAEQEVLIRGFQVNFGVVVSDCAGSVWFDELVCTGDDATCMTLPIHAAQVTDSPRVTFTRCQLSGESESGSYVAFQAGAGLVAKASIVHLFDCTITGGDGQWSSFQPQAPTPGGAGMRIETSTVTVIGCTIRGGSGGVRSNTPCSGQNAPGGPGIAFVGDGGLVRSAQSPATGGVVNLNPLCPGQFGPAGPDVSGHGTILALPGIARHLSGNSPLRGGETLTLEVAGGAGELPFVLVSLDHRPTPLLNGSLLVSLIWEDVLVVPQLNATGVGTLVLQVPNVGPIVASTTFYAQAVFFDELARIWLGPGTSNVLLDQGL